MKKFFLKSLIVFLFVILSVLIIGKGFFVYEDNSVNVNSEWEYLGYVPAGTYDPGATEFYDFPIDLKGYKIIFIFSKNGIFETINFYLDYDAIEAVAGYDIFDLGWGLGFVGYNGFDLIYRYPLFTEVWGVSK